MRRTRPYKVVAILANGERALLSPDGDCWQCEASWPEGHVIEVPLKLVTQKEDRSMVPDWEAVGITSARHWKVKDPIVMVMEFWGHDAADRNF